MNPYILGPVFGALAGAFMGWLMNERSILGTANWIPGFVLMGILWGISGAAKFSAGWNEDPEKSGGRNEDPEKGELLTETRDYRKKLRKRERDNRKQDE